MYYYDSYYARDPFFLRIARLVDDVHRELYRGLHGGSVHGRALAIGSARPRAALTSAVGGGSSPTSMSSAEPATALTTASLAPDTLDELVHLLERPPASGGRGGPVVAPFLPAVDLAERGGKYVLQMDVPGMTSADLEVRIEDGRALVVVGERHYYYDNACSDGDDELQAEGGEDDDEPQLTATGTTTPEGSSDDGALTPVAAGEGGEGAAAAASRLTTTGSSIHLDGGSAALSPTPSLTPESPAASSADSRSSGNKGGHDDGDDDAGSSQDGDDVAAACHHIRERFHGRFARRVLLPPDVDITDVDATVHNGVLTVVIGKSGAPRNSTRVRVR
jgi:HSP20 family molecular chaperone IbpA